MHSSKMNRSCSDVPCKFVGSRCSGDGGLNHIMIKIKLQNINIRNQLTPSSLIKISIYNQQSIAIYFFVEQSQTQSSCLSKYTLILQIEKRQENKADMTEHYRVEKIIDKRVINGKNHYKIKWLNYPQDQSTWEPQKHLSTCKDLIKKFNDNLVKLQQTKQKKKRRKEAEQQEADKAIFEEQKSESNDNKFKRPFPSNLKKGPSPKKNAPKINPANQKNFQESEKEDCQQQKEKLLPKINPQAKSNKLTEGAKVEVLGMVQIDGMKYFRINQNGKTKQISREQLINQDPIALVHFYQSNMRFLPSK